MDKAEEHLSKLEGLKQIVDQLFLSDEVFDDVLKKNGTESSEFVKALTEDPQLSEYLQRRLSIEKLRIYAEYLKYLPTVFLKLLSLLNLKDEDPKVTRSVCTDYLSLQKQFSDFHHLTGFDMPSIEDDLPKEDIKIKPKTASKMLSLLAKDAKTKETHISNIRFETDDPTQKEEPPPSE
jgi:hypothetical protein